MSEYEGGYGAPTEEEREELSKGSPASNTNTGAYESAKKPNFLVSAGKRLVQGSEKKRTEKREISQAREEGRREGRIAGAVERGREEGYKQGRGGGGVVGFLKDQALGKRITVKSVTTKGKGKNRRTVTTYRQVRERGSGGGTGGILGNMFSSDTSSLEKSIGFGGLSGSGSRGRDRGLDLGDLERSLQMGPRKKSKKRDDYSELGF